MPPVETLGSIGLVTTCCNLIDRLHPLFVFQTDLTDLIPAGSLHAVLTIAQATPRTALSLWSNAVDVGSQQLASHPLF